MTEEQKIGEQTEETKSADTEATLKNDDGVTTETVKEDVKDMLETEDVKPSEETETVKEDKIDYKTKYEETQKKYDSIQTMAGKNATKADLLQKELDTIRTAKKGEADKDSKVQDDKEFEALDNPEKFEEVMRTKGAKPIFKLLEKRNLLNSEKMLKNVFTELGEAASLHSKYPELKDAESEFAKTHKSVMAEYGLKDSTKDKTVAAELTKLRLGIVSAGDTAAQAADDAEKGLQKKADKSHVEVNTKGKKVQTSDQLTAQEIRFCRQSGIKEDEYKKAKTHGKTTKKGKKIYTYEEHIKEAE